MPQKHVKKMTAGKAGSKAEAGLASSHRRVRKNQQEVARLKKALTEVKGKIILAKRTKSPGRVRALEKQAKKISSEIPGSWTPTRAAAMRFAIPDIERLKRKDIIASERKKAASVSKTRKATTRRKKK